MRAQSDLWVAAVQVDNLLAGFVDRTPAVIAYWNHPWREPPLNSPPSPSMPLRYTAVSGGCREPAVPLGVEHESTGPPRRPQSVANLAATMTYSTPGVDRSPRATMVRKHDLLCP